MARWFKSNDAAVDDWREAAKLERAISVHEQWVGKTELKGLLRTKVPRSFGYLVALVKTGRASVDEAKLQYSVRQCIGLTEYEANLALTCR